MKSLGAAVRISSGSPPASRMASATRRATSSRCAKQTDSFEDVLTIAIFGRACSSTDRPIAVHCARRTAQRVVPGSKLLRSEVLMTESLGGGLQGAAVGRHDGAHALAGD